jgi:hypothetical protein
MDNFDLKKFLKESKALENLNPTLKSLNEGEAAYEYEKGKEDGEKIEKKKMTKEAMKKHIKDMIVAELELSIDDSGKADDADANADLNDFLAEDDKTPEEKSEEDEALLDGGFGSFEEAKKKEEEVDVEDVEVTGEEDVPAADAEITGAEDVPAADSGLDDIAADMEGTEGELMDSLMKAFKIAKGMGNEKLETQVGNTLKFFVSEYIGGEEN